ncbi:MAG: uracil-DNA glycosylase [Gammaproteobacteria bacterium]|nr:uracil-DNA glycosylase [Gammaproteobacteria bacterium]
MNQPEQQRRAYLEALGIDVWVGRDSQEPAESPASRLPQAADVAGAPPEGWEELRECVAGCTRCELSQSRTNTVFGVGSPDADWMIIGEAPGAEEDRQGEPFVGRAGMLLDQMLFAIGQSRESVFIANILKCRPPHNRDPRPEEAAACRDYLQQQIDLVQPRIILAVGRIAAQNLLGSDDPVGRMRGRPHDLDGIPLVVTYHPAYLLRSPSQKRKSWSDLCLAARLAAEASE